MKTRSTRFPRLLSRFTTLPVLVDILQMQHLVLLDPKTWEDRNDAYYIERYKEQRDLKTVLALCFSTKAETFHHWKVFSSGSSGIRIEFKAEELIASAKGQGIKCRSVMYKLIKDVESPTPNLADWPFLKRKPYADEGEYRFLHENLTSVEESKAIEIRLSYIRRISMSPWMPKAVAASVIDLLRRIPDCNSFEISRSTLLENSRWKRAITPKLRSALE